VNPTLPSAANLIDSFLKDLRGIASLFGGQAGQRPTIQKTLWCGSSTAILTADQDYVIVDVSPLSVGSFVLAAAPTTVAAISFGNGTTFDVIAAMQSATALCNFHRIRWDWRAGTKIYLVSASGVGVVLTLET
jgi:hypothetical protein